MGDLSLGISFAAGMLSFLSPCVLPLALVYVVNLSGASALTPDITRRRVVSHAVTFVVGFSLVFAGLGASAGLIGAAIPVTMLYRIAGSLLILFGLWLLASRKIPRLNYSVRLGGSLGRGSGYLRSVGLGAAFALGWTPCVGPVLAGILALASSAQTAWQGAYLLLVYSLGLGLPFIAIALAMGSAGPVIAWLGRRANAISIVSGVLLIIVGIGLLTSYLTRLISLTF
ncbi:MAG: cytochrome c biogenesis protein CcdA [Dehalococcoidia bacterium]|nr:cytochrome c biogenesis protein CcdA [Dehalococcoidia bacterium]